MEKDKNPEEISGTSGYHGKIRPKPRKVNIWQKVDVVGEMDAPDVLHLEEDLSLQGVMAYDQQRLEQGMMDQMDQVFNERQKTLERKRALRESKQVEAEIREVKFTIKQAERALEIVLSQKSDKETKKRLDSVKRQKENKEKQLKSLQAKLKRLQTVAGVIESDKSMTGDDAFTEDIDKATSSVVSWALTGKGEEERARLIKLGHMTPFGSVADEGAKEQKKTSQKRKLFLDGGFSDYLTSQEKTKKKPKEVADKKKPQKMDKNFKIPRKKKSNGLKAWLEEDDGECGNLSAGTSGNSAVSAVIAPLEKDDGLSGSDAEYHPDQEEESRMKREDLDDEELMNETAVSGKRKKKQPRYNPETGLPFFDNADGGEDTPTSKKTRLKSGPGIKDDGKLSNYTKRMQQYRQKLAAERAQGIEQPEDKDLGNGFKVPGKVWSKLYKYQRTGVRWLWELHSQTVGGILGDEMGLGKTIEIISFLSGLHHSGLRSRSVPGHGYEGLGPVLIVTPTTIMHQWVREFHAWWPPLRVAILHDSGTYDSSRMQLVDNVARSNGILITSYERARINVEMLLDQGWHYVILDEGHKIRNPEAAVTVALKLFRTPHRLILSGSPVQNNLRELWSLFDFIFPGKLGTLPVFMEQFSVPIVQGGYSNATEVQVHTAYKCACKLRDTISPYLLRRMKRDVQLSLELPAKNEQVLFCRLTQHQIDVYKKYLDSDTVHSILTREMKVFAGLIQLRKICNHPDLYTGGPKIMVGEATPSPRDERSFGFCERSGKMLVVASLLKIWKKQGHKVLLFSQSRAMLDILEIYVSSRGYQYLCMHGGTSVQSRQPLIKKFNEDSSIFVFLLTTRVGGLGVNLTGADRVVIFDPDWNPSTDSQAQERAWRIGQKRDVTIYRLLTSGTIEEKIYHRQIFKQFLTNRILKDPWQRRFFKSNDLHELFLLKDYGEAEATPSKDDKTSCITETGAIFAGTGSEVRPSMEKRKKSSKRSWGSNRTIGSSVEQRPTIRNRDKTAVLANNVENNETATLHSSAQNTADDVVFPKFSEEKKIIDSNGHASASPKTVSCPKNVDAILDSSNATGNSVDATTGVKDLKSDLTQIGQKDDDCLAEKNSSSSSLKESLLRAKRKFDERKKAEETRHPVKRKKKNKRKRGGLVDGEAVSNVTTVEDYKPSGQSAEEIEEKSRKATDDYVLHRLFKRAGVHSALQHNVIMDSAHPDYALVEVEAERVAKESVRNLRLSRRQYQFPTGRNAENFKPRFGKKSAKVVDKDDSAMLKVEKHREKFKASHIKPESDNSESDNSEEASSSSNSPAPLSASQLLSSMRRRNHEEIHKQEELDASQAEEENELFGFNLSQSSVGGASSCLNPTEHDEILSDLRSFIAFQCQVDGQARTSEIMAEFGDKVQPTHAAVFKSILKQLCDSEDSRDSNEKIWTLKPEYR